MSYNCFEKMDSYWVPELDYIFSSNIVNCFTSTLSVPISSVVNRMFENKNSIFTLLFSPIFTEDEYYYLFSTKNSSELPSSIWERISPIKNLAKYWVSTKDGYNIFDFSDEDISMFDYLYNFKKNNGSFIYVDFKDLKKPLSKMIYIYLDLFSNNKIDHILDLKKINTTTILDNMYKIYLISEAHNFISKTSHMIESRKANILPKRDIYKIVSEYDPIILTNIPVNCDIVAFINGIQMKPDDFSYNEKDNTIELHIKISPEDIIVVDYWILQKGC